MKSIFGISVLYVLGACVAVGCSSSPATSQGTAGGSAVSTGTPGDNGSAAAPSTADAGAPAPGAATIPGPLHFGGSLPLPGQPSYVSNGCCNHPDQYKLVVSNATAYFGSDWAITVTEDGHTGDTYVWSLDVQTGALYAKTWVSGLPDIAATTLAAPAPTDTAAQNNYRPYVDSAANIVAQIVAGLPPDGPGAGPHAPANPAAQPYLDYFNLVRSQVGGPAFPPDGKTLPVSLLNGGRLPILSMADYDYSYPVAPGGGFHISVAEDTSMGGWTLKLDWTYYPGVERVFKLNLEDGSFSEDLTPGGGDPSKPQHFRGPAPFENEDTGFYNGLLQSFDQRLSTIVSPNGGDGPPRTELQPYLDYIKGLEVKYPATAQTPTEIP